MRVARYYNVPLRVYCIWYIIIIRPCYNATTVTIAAGDVPMILIRNIILTHNIITLVVYDFISMATSCVIIIFSLECFFSRFTKEFIDRAKLFYSLSSKTRLWRWNVEVCYKICVYACATTGKLHTSFKTEHDRNFRTLIMPTTLENHNNNNSEKIEL